MIILYMVQKKNEIYKRKLSLKLVDTNVSLRCMNSNKSQCVKRERRFTNREKIYIHNMRE